MARYHVNLNTHKSGICRSNIRSCPLGEAPHFESRIAANDFIRKIEKLDPKSMTALQGFKKPKRLSLASRLMKDPDFLNEEMDDLFKSIAPNWTDGDMLDVVDDNPSDLGATSSRWWSIDELMLQH